MGQWTAVYTSEAHAALKNRKSVMERGSSETPGPGAHISPETVTLAESLVLNLPEFSWTIEVDIAGRHRVTIHFKGGEVSVDE